jgi:hypothetical protein
MQTFFKTDLAAGYWQIPVEEKNRDVLAFGTPWGAFRFCVLPFGVASAVSAFQSGLEDTLRTADILPTLVNPPTFHFPQAPQTDNTGTQLQNVATIQPVVPSSEWEEIESEKETSIIRLYIDDILGGQISAAIQIDKLDKLFTCLERDGHTLAIEKCAFLLQSLDALGFRVTSAGVQPNPNTVSDLQKLGYPRDKKELQSAQGVLNVYRRMIPDFADIALAWRHLLSDRQGIKFEFDDKCKEAFDTLKQRLSSAPILGHFDPSPTAKLVICSDASQQGFGAVLMQIYTRGESEELAAHIQQFYRIEPRARPPRIDTSLRKTLLEGTMGKQGHILEFFSRSLRQHELGRSAVELESGAILQACQRWASYIMGTTCIVVTDQSALTSPMAYEKMLSKRLIAIHLRLQQFTLRFVFRAGKLNQLADLLSRLAGVEAHRLDGSRVRDEAPTWLRVTAITRAKTRLDIEAEKESDTKATKKFKSNNISKKRKRCLQTGKGDPTKFKTRKHNHTGVVKTSKNPADHQNASDADTDEKQPTVEKLLLLDKTATEIAIMQRQDTSLSPYIRIAEARSKGQEPTETDLQLVPKIFLDESSLLLDEDNCLFSLIGLSSKKSIRHIFFPINTFTI